MLSRACLHLTPTSREDYSTQLQCYWVAASRRFKACEGLAWQTASTCAMQLWSWWCCCSLDTSWSAKWSLDEMSQGSPPKSLWYFTFWSCAIWLTKCMTSFVLLITISEILYQFFTHSSDQTYGICTCRCTGVGPKCVTKNIQFSV